MQSSESTVKKLNKEITILKTALDIKIDSLKIKGDIRGGILYELGETKAELKCKSEEVIELKENINNLNQSVSFLIIILVKWWKKEKWGTNFY